ncbi:rod shape-determining protein MreD [Melghiribacillus thermohalophilus]|uniref:Rod shape-determining protein MreD n=1 Tax=Melghiribacillus thermohalophilus TaxID=1324956 RepID=A0A4R3NBT0_9BACI|nr:rod shape-determining protein MreD [Melghiribacillus thermohalophilus]TCT27129.1 rod shape-determining protein MreD [Melghiribacillus thermohalophilus]
MKRIILPLFLLLFLVLEGIFPELVPRKLNGSEIYIIPYFVMSFLILMAIFYDYDQTYQSIYYAIVFGFLTDLLYTDLIGVYMFTYGAVAYFVHKFKRVLHANFFVTFILTLFGVSLSDTLIYMMYAVIQITSMAPVEYGMTRLLPTVLANMITMAVLYPLFYRRMWKWSEELMSHRKTV